MGGGILRMRLYELPGECWCWLSKLLGGSFSPCVNGLRARGEKSMNKCAHTVRNEETDTLY